MDDKIGILDIKAKINDSINCNIEMQVVDRHNIAERILFYWSGDYKKSIKSGQDYDKLEKTLAILITDYEIEEIKEVKKYLSKWNIREEDYPEIILTDRLEFFIMELPKFNKYKNKAKNKQVNLWAKFIENPEVISMDEEEEIKKAREVLQDLSNDARERELAEYRLKYIMDNKAIEKAGYIKGKKDGTVSVAKKLKSKGIDIETIIQTTGLTKQEIENL